MERILVLIHPEADGSLGKADREVLQAASTLSSALGTPAFLVGLVGNNLQAAGNAVARCGASRILGVKGSDFATARYGTDAAGAAALVHHAQATIVLAAATSRWARVLAGVACRLGGRIDTHATGLAVRDGALTLNRWFYRQRMEGSLQRTPRPWIITLEPGIGPAWTGDPGEVGIEEVPVSLTEEERQTNVAGLQAPAADAQTIRSDAKLLLVAGAGWTKKQADGQVHAAEAQQIILNFLRTTQASLGGTKSLVDLSGEGQAVLPFMTHLNQVGQTGSTPRHPKGLATCCHGEEPHVVGWRFINERRAINLDPNCGWARGKADVVYVADAFAVMAKVNEFLDKQ
ncbi:MAG TPA: electron transfer flavoprotein subunit alpha [Candidatus Paceibacterota bacterium]|nr:electron transfer flavoprotein subunit alpha [Candidatus Paceibacterota bacterium]HRZ99174.1 electron transfer flavoprotein subunit alpha [Candidatus Paceibacterota bacterium]